MLPSRSGSLAADIVVRQNPDGGWGYRPGKSWTEPTCYAVLALSNTPDWSETVARGKGWLAARQRQDGGWAPSLGVDRSTWVTSLAVLAIAGAHSDAILRESGMRWIIQQTSADSGLLERIRRRLIGVSSETFAPPAWPWFPGTSSWVTPTAISMLSLQGCQLPGAMDRVEMGAQFLLQRRCADGGWNHGGSSVRSDNAASYPETTGLALLSLRGRTGPAIDKALAKARELSQNPGSASGLAWLRMGLQAHAQQPSYKGPDFPCWTVLDSALTLLSGSAEGRSL